MTGPSLLAKILGCSVSCECDVVVHVDDLEHVDEKECDVAFARNGATEDLGK